MTDNVVYLRSRRAPTTIELWDAWLFAELDAELALRWWWEGPHEHQADAFKCYRDALDREAEAARALQARLARPVRYAAA
jgi:hypothetical protein